MRNFCVALAFGVGTGFNVPDAPNLMRSKLRELAAEPMRVERALRLREASARKMKTPDELEPETVSKMEKLGYSFAEGKWQRSSAVQSASTSAHDLEYESHSTYMRDMDAQALESESSTRLDARSVWAKVDDEELFYDPLLFTPKATQRFVPAAQTTTIDDPVALEKLGRLGFSHDGERWSRGAARRTAKTVLVESGNRELEVRAIEEHDLAAVDRLEYLLERLSIEEPQNVADAVCRVARSEGFASWWLAAQYKMWLVWSAAPQQLGGAPDFLGELQTASAEWWVGPLALSAVAFCASSRLTTTQWRGSGSVAVGALERAMADTLTGSAAAPETSAWREEQGLAWRCNAALLSLGAALPRVAFVHAYAQPKLQALFTDYTQNLDAVMDDSGAGALCAASLLSVALVGALSMAAEATALNWARPPKTGRDELWALADALETDALTARLAADVAKRVGGSAAERRKTRGFFTLKTAVAFSDKAARDAAAFEKVATAWVDAFHGAADLSDARAALKKTVDVDDVDVDLRADFGLKVVALAGARSSAAALAFALSGGALEAPLVLHLLASVLDLKAVDKPALKIAPVLDLAEKTDN